MERGVPDLPADDLVSPRTSPVHMHVRDDIRADLVRLGLRPGDLVMVHASMRAVGPVLGGGDEVIEALLAVLGPDGTLMAYVDWEHGAQRLTRDDRDVPLPERIRDGWPAFDPAKARADRSYGILPELLRTWPGARRSGNPGASVAAVGARAEWICRDHPLDYGYGPGSPLAKLVEAEGRVLLLGSPLETVTLLHFSEHTARLRDKRVIRYREKLVREGRPEWVVIEEFDTADPVVEAAPDDHFDRLVRAYVEAHDVSRGKVGDAWCHLFEAPSLHRFGVAWLEERWGEDRGR